ncbi:MAG: protein kinase [Polyangiales bacterium]
MAEDRRSAVPASETDSHTRVSRPQGRDTKGTLPLGAGPASGRAEDGGRVSATAGTMADPFEQKTLAPLADGLRQYLVIRLASPEEGSSAYARLRDRLASVGHSNLAEAPGVKARAYRMAREIASPPSEASKHTLPWFRATPAHDPLSMLRARGDADRELLELRHARKLEPVEIAFVVGRPEAEVVERLAAAEEELRALLAREGHEHATDLPSAVLEAFALRATVDADDPDVLPRVPTGVVLDGRYELEKHVGSGGFADVYRARDVAVPGHVVALKLLKRAAASPEARDHALRELRLIAAVFHPSIVQFKDHGWYEDRFWFVMPWYEGESLETRIEREPLTRAQARRIFEPLARALATMHASGIRHQDVKPDNIFLAKIQGFGVDLEERVLPVLLDLGVAATDAELVLAGTPTYFAPEVAAQFAYREGDALPEFPIGPAADVFALALALRNSLEPSTQPMVKDDDVEGFIRDRASAVPTPPSGPDLRYLRSHFARWLSLDPANRPTANELAEQIAVLTLPEERRERRLRVIRVFGPILLALLVVFGVVANQLVEAAAVQEEKAERLEAERAAEASRAAEAEQQAEALGEAIAEARADIENAALSREELERRLVDAQARLRVAQGNATRLRRQLQEAEKARDALQTSLDAAEAARRQLAAQLETLRGTLATRERELEEARRARTEAEARVTATEARVTATERERDAARAQAEEARAAERAAETARDQAQAATREATQEVTRLERELATARRRIEELERQLASRPTEPTTPPRIVVPTPEVDGTSTTVPSVMTRVR